MRLHLYNFHDYFIRVSLIHLSKQAVTRTFHYICECWYIHIKTLKISEDYIYLFMCVCARFE